MKQLDNIILETDSLDEVYEVFKKTFPEFAPNVKSWALWRSCDDQFRGIRVRLPGGSTLFFGMERDEDPDGINLFWHIRPIFLAPSPDPDNA